MRWSFITDGNYINFRHTDETDLHIQQTIHRLHNTSRCIDWSLPADTTRITFTIDESKYENISIYDIDFDGVVMSVQSDFDTNITAMFTGLAGGGSSSYLVYTILLSQPNAAIDNPTVGELQNTLSGTPVWTRDNSGRYTGTLVGAFPDALTVFPNNLNINGNGYTAIPITDSNAIIGYYILGLTGDDNGIYLQFFNNSFVYTDINTLIGIGKLCIDVKVFSA